MAEVVIGVKILNKKSFYLYMLDTNREFRTIIEDHIPSCPIRSSTTCDFTDRNGLKCEAVPRHGGSRCFSHLLDYDTDWRPQDYRLEFTMQEYITWLGRNGSNECNDSMSDYYNSTVREHLTRFTYHELDISVSNCDYDNGDIYVGINIQSNRRRLSISFDDIPAIRAQVEAGLGTLKTKLHERLDSRLPPVLVDIIHEFADISTDEIRLHIFK